MLINAEVVKRAEAVKAKALDFLKEEEPNLFEAIRRSIDEAARRVSETVRTSAASNPVRIQQIFIETAKEIAGLAYFAETIARDIMESRNNEKLSALVKASYQSMADLVHDQSKPTKDDEKPDNIEEALEKARADQNENKDGPSS